MCFPVNFAKFLRTSFLQKTSGQLLLDFLIHFTVLPLGELIGELGESISGHVLPTHSNVMSIMNLNDLVVAASKNTFFGDITRNLAVFCRLISIFIRTC